MLKQLYNYYMVLKTCWIILLFQLIGFVAFAQFEQGRDIIANLSFSNGSQSAAHAVAATIALLWWSWQCWRSARTELHFTQFNFRRFNKVMALQAQVLIPRLLGIAPLLIISCAIYRVHAWSNPIIFLYLNFAVLLYVFFHLRKDISKLIKSRRILKLHQLPDYVVVKNEPYPASFIWAKQSRWIIFRLFVVMLFFTLTMISPIWFPRAIGSSAIVLFALGSWQIIATVIDYAEKHYHFPFAFTLILMVLLFSFFNNNHGIRTHAHSQYIRPSIDAHFDQWYKSRSQDQDTVQVVLLASQGGGLRSAYWTAQLLSHLQTEIPNFDSAVYAYSVVSGASLGLATYKSQMEAGVKELSEGSHEILSQDFLSPVTSWLVIPEVFQKFIPFPIASLDRAKNLERSWEESCEVQGERPLARGFLESTLDDGCLYLFHSTHAENGRSVLISNADISDQVFLDNEDLFDVIDTDVPYSTAISISARFPFVTPPALVYKGNEKWGHLVDGGYVDNMGGNSLLKLYDHLKEYGETKGYKLKFTLVFFRNIKQEETQPIAGMHELLAPITTFNKVWVNSGDYDQNSTPIKNINGEDQVHFVSLNREGEQLIPLGWHLSEHALQNIRGQVPVQSEQLKQHLLQALAEN